MLLLVLMGLPGQVWAEWQIKPFLGVKFGGSTNLVGDLEGAAGKVMLPVGIATVFLGDVVGVEADLGYNPGFFQRDSTNVLSSSVTTLTGNVTVGLPRRVTEYTLRPYFVGGVGLMRARTTTRVPGVLELSRNLSAFDLGGGVTGFVTPRVGVSWDVRHFRTIQGEAGSGTTIDGGPEQLSFWRAYMALAIRY